MSIVSFQLYVTVEEDGNPLTSNNCCTREKSHTKIGCIHGWNGPGKEVVLLWREGNNPNMCEICAAVRNLY